MANAVMLNPSSLLAFCIVAFWAVVVDAGVVPLLLAFRGAAALPVIVAYVVPNGVVVLFEPLLVGNRSHPVPMVEVLEAVVVLVDEAGVKLLVALNPSPGYGYRGASCPVLPPIIRTFGVDATSAAK